MYEDGYLYLQFKYLILWEFDTFRNGDHLVMQEDGDLVLYDAYNRSLFSSNTKGKGDYLILQDDANLVIYDSNGTIQWQTNTLFSKFIFEKKLAF